MSHWDGEKRVVSAKLFRSNIFILYRITKKGLRCFYKIIYKRGLIWQDEMKKRILQNLKL